MAWCNPWFNSKTVSGIKLWNILSVRYYEREIQTYMFTLTDTLPPPPPPFAMKFSICEMSYYLQNKNPGFPAFFLSFFFLFVICACVLWFFFFSLLHPVTTQWLIPKFSGGQPSGYQTSVVLLKRRCQTANWKRSPGCSTDKRDPWCAIPPLIPLQPFSGSWDETTTAAEHVPDCWRVRQALLKTVGARRKMRGKAFASLFRCWKADLGRKEFLHALT